MHKPCYLVIQFGDELLVVAITVQRLLQGKQVLRPLVSHECLRDCRARALHPNVTEVRQAHRITVACQDRSQDGQPTGIRYVAQHVMNLQVHQAARLLYVLRVFGGHLEQAAAVSSESAHRR
jgi:hypothetical protein